MNPGSAALTQGPIARTLLTFALPILFGNVLQSLNGSVNAIWVGKFLGEAALTATGNSNTVMFLMLAGVFGVSMAATILIAQYLGAQRLEKARRVVGTSASFFTIIAIVVSAGGFLVANRLLAAMHTPADALPYATAYLRIIFLAMPFLFLYTITMAVLRGAGDSRTPFVFLSISVALDIGLNPLFIFGLGPVPRLGIAGSALATLIANASTFLALLIHLYRRHHPLCIRRGEFALLRMDPAIVRTLIVKGTPMGLQMVVISTSAVAMISLVNRFGSETTAAYAAAFQLWSYIQMPAFAIGAAVSSMAAQNVGAHHWGRVARIARAGVLFNFLVTGSVVALICIFNRHMLSLFLPTTGAAIAIAQHINYVAAWSFIFFGISMVLFAVVRATGAVTAPLLILFVAMWLVRFPLAAAMLETWKADAIWWSFPLSSGIAATLAVLYYKYGGWRSARMTPQAGIPETSVQLP
ncbi:MAG TPA: MATE family efflux transporter [Steroidobacteraceae bacterium]